MKRVIFNITHQEVFDEIYETFPAESKKGFEIINNDDEVIINITATLEELEELDNE